MKLKHRRIALSSGITLHAAERPGAGTPVICLHGIWDEWAYFEHMAMGGSFAGHPMFLFDLRGHGDSDSPESGYNLEDYAGDILTCIRDQEYEQVILAGHSLGALTSLAIAGQIPDQIEALLLEDPPVPMRNASAEVFANLLELKQQPAATVIDEFQAWRPFISEEEAVESARRLQQTADGVLKEAANRLSAIEIPYKDVVINAPVLVIQAGLEDQRAFGADGPDILAAVMPDLTLETIPDTSHNVSREQPEQYRTIVERWFDGISS